MAEKALDGGGEGEWAVVGGLRGRLRGVAAGERSAPTDAADVPDMPDMPDMPGGRGFPTARGVLTKAEIEALLRPDLSDFDSADERPLVAEAGGQTQTQSLALLALDEPVAPPAPVARDGVRRSDALVLSLRLTGVMRAEGLCDLAFLPEPGVTGPSGARAKGSVHAVFETPEHDPVALVSLESGLAGALLEQLCGSSGAGAGIAGLSALSRQLLMAALGPLGDVIGREAGMPVVLSRIETQAHLAVLAPLPETHALEWVMRASVGHGPGVKDAVTGSARVQVRVRAAQGEVAVVAGAERGWQRGEAVAGPALPAGLETRLCVRLARLSLTTAQVARWAPGQTLLLGLPADQPVSVLAGSMTGMGAGAPLAEGQIGRLGAAMAVRITRLNGPLRRPG